jgi:hypothetical protein
MQFSPLSRHLIPLRSKYPPQHPVLKHLQSMLVLWTLKSWESLVWSLQVNTPTSSASKTRHCYLPNMQSVK